MGSVRARRRLLVGLNAGLGLMLLAVMVAPQASAQARAERLPGRYLLVATPPSRPAALNGAIFVLDTVNAELMTLQWDRERREFAPAGYRSIDRDTALDPGR